jgi:APA family basic amino acid/polyamine antiporter
VQQLQRRLGLPASMGIGVAAMLGAGVFYVWTPAFELAGSWLILSLLIAGVVATLNGLVTAQLAMQLPVSGGIYAYAGHYRGPYLGFLAGWLFVTGKTASAAAIAYIAASYLAPDYAREIAAGLVVIFTAIIVSGIRVAAGVSIAISLTVILGVVWFAAPRKISASWPIFETDPSLMGIATAAGLFFFAFAGYARMATLGEEARNPTSTIPRAIVGALWIVFVIYLMVALAITPALQNASVIPDAPLQLLSSAESASVMVVLAVVASLGSLMAILAGLSRTTLAMGRSRDLPLVLSRVSSRTKGPVVAEITVAMAAIALIFFTNPLWLVGLSSAGVLTYYAIGHLSALAQPPAQRFLPTVVPTLGLVLCGLLVITLPLASLIAAAASALVGTLWFVVNPRRRAETGDYVV